jgi:N utilization substance protein B
MSLRHKGRQLALQVLFQWDIHHGTEGWLEEFWTQNRVHREARSFADQVIAGVIEQVDGLDALIGRYAEHWTVSRMAHIDRTVLRMAVYELLYLPGIPARVTLNEAITLAKLFGDDQSGAFVNGILDRVLREEPRLQAKARESASSVAHD